jgi:hypothetical protein
MTRSLTAFFLLLLLTACEKNAPTPPTTASSVPLPSPSFTGPFTLSGVVYKTTGDGRRPFPGVSIDVSPFYQLGIRPQITTDAEGRYTVGTSTGQTVKLLALKNGYSQPCSALTNTASNGLDLDVVPDEILSTTGLPSAMPIRQPTLSGLVFERTPDGPRPIPGTSVLGDFTGGMGNGTGAMTLSDALGRYVLCGVVDAGLGFEIWASKSGYGSAYVPVDVRVMRVLDIELVRQ